MSDAGRSPRRGLLKRAALAGAALAGVAAGGGRAAAAQPSDGTRTLTLFGRAWHAATLDKNGDGARGGRYTVYGELVDAEGNKVGEFASLCFSVDSPFQITGSGRGSIEMHTISLNDGTIFGMGGGVGSDRAFAIVGGTGRYQAARGSYLAKQDIYGLGGSGIAELTLAITA